MAMAFVLDPRVKMCGVEVFFPSIYLEELEAKRNIKKIQQALYDTFIEYASLANEEEVGVEGSNGLSSSTSTSLPHKSSSFGWSKLISYVKQKESAPTSKSEIERYLEESPYICENGDYT